MVHLFADEFIAIRKGERHFEILNGVGINVNDVRGYRSPGYFFNKHCGPLQSVNGDIGIGTSLETERSIGFEGMTLCCFTDVNRIEVSALQENVFGLCGNTACYSAKNSRDAHAFFHIADHRSEERRVGKECRSRW